MRYSTTTMTGRELRKLRESMNLTVTEAAALIHVSSRSWQRWEARRRAIPARVEKLLKLREQAHDQKAQRGER
ncbi:MAG: helix-turn-helix domain-containing protein [Steroidobacteraceae bacterium]